MLACLCVASCAYLYCVGASILNVVARTEAASEAQKLEGAIAVLEESYVTLSQSVDALTAGEMGLSSVGSTEYVYTPGNAAAVTMSGNGL
jgi:hypothetical protein